MSKKQQKNGPKKTETDVHNKAIFETGNLIFCTLCEREITRLTKVFCQTCDFFFCVRCFANGKEGHNHIKTHRYRIINSLDFSLYKAGWSAYEEILLLDALQKRGYGNWSDISDTVGTKTKQQCEIHYNEFWYEHKGNYQSIPVLKGNLPNGDLKLKLLKRKLPKEKKKEITLIEKKIEIYLPHLGKREESFDTFNDVLGYMPLRGDFDVEYDNEAELFLAEMEFNDDDTEEETSLKKKILEIYNKRLDERIKRKKFIITRGLLDLKKQNMLDRSRTKEEKEIYNMLKVFARFHPAVDHEKLVQNIVKERELRRRIDELKAYKKLGLRTFHDVENYILEKRKRDEHYERKQKTFDPLKLNNLQGTGGKRQNRASREFYHLKAKSDVKNTASCLSDEEISLCDNLQLTFHEYLLVKEILIRECIVQGVLTRSFAENSLKLEKEKIKGIFDFLVDRDLIVQK